MKNYFYEYVFGLERILQKERILGYLNNSKLSICTARCVIFDILAFSQNAKMLVGEYPQTPLFFQEGVL